MKNESMIYGLALMLMAVIVTQAQSPKGGVVPVTVENFIRAESDSYFVGAVNNGSFGKFIHRRELVPADSRGVVRPNRDTLYSGALFDLDAGPVTISLPDAGNRYMSMQVIDQDHFSQAVVYGAGSYSFSREKLYTRYIFVLVRTLVDPTNRNDVEQAHALQDAIKVNQNSPGRFEVPNWDQASRKKVHDALLTLGETISSFSSSRSYGTKDQVDPVRHLIRTARGWGGLPERDAFYLGVTPAKNDGVTTLRLNVKDVPVNGFWSKENAFLPDGSDGDGGMVADSQYKGRALQLEFAVEDEGVFTSSEGGPTPG